MIHFFKVCEQYLLYDVESASLSFVDKIVFDILSNSPNLEKDYCSSDLTQAQAEINQLKESGFLDVPPHEMTAQKSSDIKALCIHISHDCNLRCKYCFAGTGTYHGERSNMSFDTAKNSIDFLIQNSANRRNLEVDFFGGEPLLNFDVVKQTVEYAKQQAKIFNKHFKFTMTTNGVLLNKEISDYLNAEMDNVVLSLDGRPQLNDLHRPTANGKGSFDLIIDKFKYFRSIRCEGNYYIRGTYTNQNSNFFDDVMYLADSGFDQISVEPVVLPADHSLALNESNLNDICCAYENLAKTYVERRKNPNKWFSFFHFAVDLENGPCEKKRLVGCGAGTEYLAVTPDGNIYPCHQFAGESNFLLGNVFDKQLNRSRQDMFFDNSVNSKDKCKSCWAKYHCGGGCAANAVHFNADIQIPYELSCEITKKRLECALYVYAKEYLDKQ